ncbi:hypothetical protein D3C71_2165110 [compost metagenome]
MAILTASRMARKATSPALSRLSGAMMMVQAMPIPRVANLDSPAINIHAPVTMLRPTMASMA